jgi:hypothetical protein
MTTIVEIKEDKLQHLAEYAEKVLRYGGKMMQCVEELESEHKESYKHRYPYKDAWEEDRYYARYR